ncbi:carboxylate-amine ligase [Streptacidiphilus melanogenes]|uniref:carboxylate-amine ligase n=1 Tax=Streptacidiphilus melanogenes TaxID=411235 RepID=UPI0005A8C681|nr:glutamate--cysteine ligase [Streptacidiphilus melanogenes]
MVTIGVAETIAETIGVEEEYLLLDSLTGLPTAECPRVRGVAAALPGVADGEVGPELLKAQIEISTPVCHAVDEVGSELCRLRAAVRAAARTVGCEVAATGAAPARSAAVTPVSDGVRYAEMRSQAQVLVDEQLITGMHVHVGVPDRGSAVAAVTRLRPWLPVLAAMGANSPLWDGRDTGYASWRTLLFGRWPVSGPPPAFADAADYERRVQDLLRAGVMADRRQVYWHARPSERYPTVEVRVLDVQPSPCDAVLYVGLIRALVVRAVQEERDGVPPPADAPELLEANTWWAARYGLTGSLCDPGSGRQREAGAVVDELVEQVSPVLAATGDRTTVERGVERLLRIGTPAERQRTAFEDHGMPGLLKMITCDW